MDQPEQARRLSPIGLEKGSVVPRSVATRSRRDWSTRRATPDRARGDPLDLRTLTVFFDVLRTLATAGVSVVAEAAFQDKVWTPNLAPLADLADLRVVQCHTDASTARQRVEHRAASRTADADDIVIGDARYYDDFVRLASAAPSIAVDTTNGYDPDIDTVLAFIDAGHH